MSKTLSAIYCASLLFQYRKYANILSSSTGYRAIATEYRSVFITPRFNRWHNIGICDNVFFHQGTTMEYIFLKNLCVWIIFFFSLNISLLEIQAKAIWGKWDKAHNMLWNIFFNDEFIFYDFTFYLV